MKKLPGLNAEASLGPATRTYRTSYRTGRSSVRNQLGVMTQNVIPMDITDARGAQTQGDIALAGLQNLILASAPLAAWANSAQHAIRITNGAHNGAWYPPPYNTSYYFDFEYVGAGAPQGRYHALLNANGTTIIGIA